MKLFGWTFLKRDPSIFDCRQQTVGIGEEQTHLGEKKTVCRLKLGSCEPVLSVLSQHGNIGIEKYVSLYCASLGERFEVV